MGGGGGGGKVEETLDYRAVMDIAEDRYKKYQDIYVPAENYAIGESLNYDNEQRREQLSGQAAASVQGEFSEAIQGDLAGRARAGINPNSGNFKEALSTGAAAEAGVASDSVNRTQTALQDEANLAKKNVIALGNSQQTQAMAGLNQVASASGQRARQEAGNAYSEGASRRSAIGTLAGVGARVGTEYATNEGG